MAETVFRQQERKERLANILVVDCDVHVNETPGALAPYCDMPWRLSWSISRRTSRCDTSISRASRRATRPTRPGSRAGTGPPVASQRPPTADRGPGLRSLRARKGIESERLVRQVLGESLGTCC